MGACATRLRSGCAPTPVLQPSQRCCSARQWPRNSPAIAAAGRPHRRSAGPGLRQAPAGADGQLAGRWRRGCVQHTRRCGVGRGLANGRTAGLRVAGDLCWQAGYLCARYEVGSGPMSVHMAVVWVAGSLRWQAHLADTVKWVCHSAVWPPARQNGSPSATLLASMAFWPTKRSSMACGAGQRGGARGGGVSGSWASMRKNWGREAVNRGVDGTGSRLGERTLLLRTR